MAEVYKLVIQQEFRLKAKSQRGDANQIQEALSKAPTELSNARKLLLSGEIEPSDYQINKKEYEKKITVLATRLMDTSRATNNIDSLINKALSSLTSLNELYEKGENKTKREIIGSISPEKLVFNGFNYRTARLNEAVPLT